MKFLQRLNNLWKLSELESGKPQDEYKEPGTELITLVKKPKTQKTTQKAVFIPHIKLTPIQELNKDEN